MIKTPQKPNPHHTSDEAEHWARFERAVDAAVKSGPKHRGTKPPKDLKKSDAKSARPQREKR
ncbi:MAG TPA: hypothetical protein VKV77_11235 [Methylovirgula sp.]|nr:hypothetical protein [Methylovirgula sp.]